MDIKKLKQEYPILLDYMQQHGYGKVAIEGIQVRLKELFEQEGHYASYEDFYKKLLESKGIGIDDKRSMYYRLSVRRIEAFDEYGHFPDRFAFAPTLHKDSSMTRLNGVFKVIIEHHKEKATRAGKSTDTIKKELKNAASFFAFMQSKGAHTLKDITEPLILSYFYDGWKQLRGYSCQKASTEFCILPKGYLVRKNVNVFAA